MSFELHPIFDAGVSPRPGVWYAIAPEGGKKAPSPRVGSGAMEVAGAGTVWVSGGATLEEAYSDLFELKITSDTVSWRTLPSSSLPPRYEHFQTLSPAGELMVFAGAKQSDPLNDMWKYDKDAGQWSEVKVTTGSPPSPRTHLSYTSTWKGKIVVFSGGHSGTETTDNCLYIFDTVTSSWHSPPTTGTPPTPRQGHLTAVIGDKLYVHGGMTVGGRIHGDFYTLSLDTLEWSQPEVTGTSPPPLCGHGCAVIGKRLYMFGGLSDNGETINSLYYLDTDGLVWTKVVVEGPPPPRRLDHAMCTVSLPLPRPESEKGSSLGKESASSVPASTDATSPPLKSTSSASSPLPPQPSPPHIVTIIGPETGSDASTTGTPTVSTSDGDDMTASAAVGKTGDYLSRAESESAGHGGGPLETVTALFVFGGVDANGFVHSDCFIIVPP